MLFFESTGQWSNLSSYGMALPISPLSAVGTTTSSCAATCHEPCGHTTRCNTPSRTPQGDGMCQHRHTVHTTPPVGTVTPCRAPPRPSHDARHHAASHDTACGHRHTRSCMKDDSQLTRRHQQWASAVPRPCARSMTHSRRPNRDTTTSLARTTRPAHNSTPHTCPPYDTTPPAPALHAAAHDKSVCAPRHTIGTYAPRPNHKVVLRSRPHNATKPRNTTQPQGRSVPRRVAKPQCQRRSDGSHVSDAARMMLQHALMAATRRAHSW